MTPMTQSVQPAASRAKVFLGYGLMTVTALGLFLVIQTLGQDLTAPAAVASLPLTAVTAHGAAPDTLLQVLVALLVVIVVSRSLGALFRVFHQPPVVGEILAGILLGPSLCGQFAPALSAQLFAPTVTPMLGVLADVGVLLFMFLVGVELNTNVFRERAHTTLAISHASILVPFLLGSTLALWLYPVLSSADVSFTAFTLFMGISMSVTAFPVLARILTDRSLQRTRIGTLALTCAAIDDVTAWCLLALVVGIIQAKVLGAGVTALLSVGYIAVMVFVVRHWIGRWVASHEGQQSPPRSLMAVVGIALLLSSLVTHYIGIHAFFGAFLIGAVIPHDSSVARVLHDRLHDFVVVMLLPLFFALVGLKTEIGLVAGSQWWICGVVILTACLGKFGGTVIAAKLTGTNWRDAACLGALMNTRGLMQLIVLNVGLDLKVISPTLFTMLVIMAVVTTFAATPVLDALTRTPWEVPPDDGYVRANAG